MALRFQLLPLKSLSQSLKPQSFPSTASIQFRRLKPQIYRCNNKTDDANLAADLATEVAKMNTQLAQREEAMRKSKGILFSELCRYLAVEKDELRRKWSKLDQEEKWVLVERFVNDWGDNFHPLSARSVKEMVDEYLSDEVEKPLSSSSALFPGFKRIIGLSQND